MSMKKTLQQLRDERKLSQFALAVEAHVSLSTIAKIEGGRVEPRLSTARRLAAVFGLRLDDIAWPNP